MSFPSLRSQRARVLFQPLLLHKPVCAVYCAFMTSLFPRFAFSLWLFLAPLFYVYAMEDWSEPRSAAPYDVFISHAGEQKAEVVAPILEVLEKSVPHLKVFLDEYSMQRGEALAPAIKRAIDESRMFIFILSPNFAAKKWPMLALDRCLKRYQEDCTLTLLPVFYELTVADCDLSPNAFFERYRTSFQRHSLVAHAPEQATGRSLDTVLLHLRSLTNHAGVSMGPRGVISEVVAAVGKLPAREEVHVKASGGDSFYRVYRIPAGYSYKRFRIRPGAVFQRSVCRLYYAVAASIEALDALLGQARSTLAGDPTLILPSLSPVGEVEAGYYRARVTNHLLVPMPPPPYAALVICGRTNGNKPFRWPSKVDMVVEIGLCAAFLASSQHEAGEAAASMSPSDTSEVPSLVNTEQIPLEIEEVAAGTPPLDLPAPPGTHVAARALHERKQTNPFLVLSVEESIQLLSMYIAEGVLNAQRLRGKEAVVVLGNTGAGKSTFLNYLMGCEMTTKTPAALGLVDLSTNVVVVRPCSEGGPLDDLMPIGHGKQSKTFLPHIEQDPNPLTPYAYCDCTGFLDNRWPEVKIANAVNIRRALQEASNVRIIVLVNYKTLEADRGRGLSDLLTMCTQLFGSSEQLIAHKDHIRLGITQVPPHERLDRVREFLLHDSPAVLSHLTEHLFFYDSLEAGGIDFTILAGCRSLVDTLPPLQDASKLFRTVLTDSDERMLRELVAHQCAQLKIQLDHHDYAAASSSWQLLQHFKIIDSLSVDSLLQHSSLDLMDFLTQLERAYQHSCHFHDYPTAKRLLGRLEHLFNHFPFAAITLDLPLPTDLRAYLTKCAFRAKVEQAEKQQRLTEHRSVPEDKRQRLAILDRQRQDTAAPLFKMQEKNKEQQVQCAKNIHQLEEKRASGLQQQIGTLAHQKELDNEQLQSLADAHLPVVYGGHRAFGRAAWKEYFGVDVGKEPKLPADIEAILDKQAPFKLEDESTPQRVRDNHLLTLIPGTVDGEAFTLDKLGALLLRNSSNHFAAFAGNTQKELGGLTRMDTGIIAFI